MRYFLLLSCLALLLAGSFAASATEPALLPHVVNNVALKAVKSTAYKTIIRDGFTTAGDGGAATYTSSNAACSLNAGAGDNGSQVRSADSKCWIGVFQDGQIDVRQFGATASPADSTTAFQNAHNVNGYQVVVPAATWNIAGAITPNPQSSFLIMPGTVTTGAGAVVVNPFPVMAHETAHGATGLSANLLQSGGASTTGVAGRYLFTDVNSTGTTNAGAGAVLVNDDFSGASLYGDRSAMAIVLNQSAATQASASPGYNYSGANIYSQLNYNMGGTNAAALGTSSGQNFGANIIAQLGAGATHYAGNVGLEVDIQTVAGSSAYKQVGIYSVKIGPTSGTLDAAFAVDAQGQTWKTGLDLGLASNPYNINSTLIGCLGCVTGVKNGLYWPSVTFSDYAFKFGGAISADNLGNVSIAGSNFVVGTDQPFRLNTGGQGTIFVATASALSPAVMANQVTALATPTGQSPGLIATGTDTNINLALLAKGIGAVYLEGYVNLSLMTNGGASAKTVCVDANGIVLTKVGAC